MVLVNVAVILVNLTPITSVDPVDFVFKLDNNKFLCTVFYDCLLCTT